MCLNRLIDLLKRSGIDTFQWMLKMIFREQPPRIKALCTECGHIDSIGISGLPGIWCARCGSDGIVIEEIGRVAGSEKAGGAGSYG